MTEIDLSKPQYLYSIFFSNTLIEHLEFKPFSIHSDEFRVFINNFCKSYRCPSAIVRMYGFVYSSKEGRCTFTRDFVFEEFFVEKDG